MSSWPQRGVGRFFDRVYVRGRRYGCYDQQRYRDAHDSPTARSTGFDWALFQVMTDDAARVECYRRDLEQVVAGRTVLEIGPGPVALLTRAALAAGARSVVSVEGSAWVAAAARRRLDRTPGGDRVTVVDRYSDDLDATDTGGRTHFDVLLLECYHAIATQERVAETVATLREHGFTFDQIVSRGFDCDVSPAAAPDATAMTAAERLIMGWPAGVAAAQHAMATRMSSLHGDPEHAAALRLAPAQTWQSGDLESEQIVDTATELVFDDVDPDAYAGLLFSSRFWFHHGEVLDTATTPTSWGTYWVPLGLPARPRATGPATLVLRTEVADPRRPSEVVLTATLDDVVSAPLRL